MARASASPRRPDIRLRRIYDADGGKREYRVLVDRLWPRGISKSEAALDEWLKDAAPSAELRRWFSHDPQRFDEFARRYRAELRDSPAASAALAHLAQLAQVKTVVILTATRDLAHSGAEVLHHSVIGRASRRRHATVTR
jgi:uncharacterized protein YeaO (DUF488 family)